MKLFCYLDNQLQQWGLPFASLNAHTASRDLLRLSSREELQDGISFTKKFVELWYIGEWDQQNHSYKECKPKKINWFRAAENLTAAIEEEESEYGE